jgi:hypothetical protein
MKILHLTLKKKWFDMIASGEKKEEYREIKPYWVKRLSDMHIGSIGGDFMNMHVPVSFTFKGFDIVSANNGYQKDCPNIKWQHKGIRIGEGKPEWGAEPGKKYFILEIGDLLNSVQSPDECDATKVK